MDDKLITSDVDATKLAIRTAGLLASDIGSLVRKATSRSLVRIFRVLRSLDSTWTYTTPLNFHSIIGGYAPLSDEDLAAVLDSARLSYAEAIGAPKIPSVTWDDVGGLMSVKSDILDTIQLPLERPELFADGLKKRSGMTISPSTLPFMLLITARHSPLWPSGNGQDPPCKGSRDILLPEFFVGQGARTSEYVYWRIRGQCPQNLPAGKSSETLCHLF